MNKDLYFLKLIADALRGDQPRNQIKEALEKIHRLGQKPEYKQGYIQFTEFLKEIIKNDQDLSLQATHEVQDLIYDMILQFSLGLIESESPEHFFIKKLIEFNPQWKKEYDRLTFDVNDDELMPGPIEIIFEINGKQVARIPWTGRMILDEIGGVRPGSLSIRLNTGRVLWEGELTAKDLLFTEAFPDEDLQLAADTGDHKNSVSRILQLLDGELIIRVHPDIEFGRIEVRMEKASS
jgi:hypothetical protein